MMAIALFSSMVFCAIDLKAGMRIPTEDDINDELKGAEELVKAIILCKRGV